MPISQTPQTTPIPQSIKLLGLLASKSNTAGPVPSLLDWPSMQKYFAWGVIILIGGSFAMADACQKSGLSADIGALFENLFAMPDWLLAALLCVITSSFTEFGSNVATATIFLPIVAKLAEGYHIHPFYLMFSVTIAASSHSRFQWQPHPIAVFDWAQKFLLVLFSTSCVYLLCINTLGYRLFNMGEFPVWAGQQNTAMYSYNNTINIL